MKRVYTFPLLFLFPFLAFTQVSDNMSLLGNWDDDTLPLRANGAYSDVWGYYDIATGKEYGIIGSIDEVHILDVSTPSAITEVARFVGGGSSIWRDMKVYGTTLYCVADENSEGMMIIDLSDMTSGPQLVSQPTTDFIRAHNVFVDNTTGRLYVIGSNTQSNGLIVYDLTANPTAPTKLANINLPGGYVHDLYAQNNIVYANHGFSGLYIYDFSDPQNPNTLATLTSYPESGYNHSCWLSGDGNYLMFCDETHNRGVKVLKVDDLDNLTVTDVFRSALLAPANSASLAHNPLIKGNIAYISYYHDGIQVYDMSDPTNVVRVGYYDTYTDNTDYGGFDGAWGVYPFLPSGNILGSDILNGLFVLSLNSGALPVEWLSFDAQIKGATVQLDWRTGTETNSDRFEVERSTDGIRFEQIGSVAAAGNSQYELDYTFEDKTPSKAWNYYRLRQVDYDGKSEYSETRAVRFSSGTFRVAPNPVRAGQTIQLELPFENTPFELQLYNSLGQLAWSIQRSESTFLQTFELPKLAAGMYLFVAKTSNLEVSQRLLIKD